MLTAAIALVSVSGLATVGAAQGVLTRTQNIPKQLILYLRKAGADKEIATKIDYILLRSCICIEAIQAAYRELQGMRCRCEH